MRTRIGALVATAAAAASAVAAATWAKRKRGDEKPQPKVAADPVAKAPEPSQAARSIPEPSDSGAEAGLTADAGDLTAIKGLGAKSAERLTALGVTSLAQIAAWTDDDIDVLAPQIKVGAERIRHEDWVGQARAATQR